MTTVAFGVTEFTLVFRRSSVSPAASTDPYRGWMLVRPAALSALLSRTSGATTNATTDETEIGQMLVVPVYSTLALDGSSYERFLVHSGVLTHALGLLARVRLTEARAAETVRKRIQSRIMAAEVQAIIDAISA